MTMNLDDVLLGMVVCFICFIYATAGIMYVRPRQEIVIARVFDMEYYPWSDITVIFTYGEGILKFYGEVDVILGKTYVFVYRQKGRYDSTSTLIELIES